MILSHRIVRTTVLIASLLGGGCVGGPQPIPPPGGIEPLDIDRVRIEPGAPGEALIIGEQLAAAEWSILTAYDLDETSSPAFTTSEEDGSFLMSIEGSPADTFAFFIHAGETDFAPLGLTAEPGGGPAEEVLLADCLGAEILNVQVTPATPSATINVGSGCTSSVTIDRVELHYGGEDWFLEHESLPIVLERGSRFETILSIDPDRVPALDELLIIGASDQRVIVRATALETDEE